MACNICANRGCSPSEAPCVVCDGAQYFVLKKDCGTCAHNANGWACDKCADHNKWTRHEIYEGGSEEMVGDASIPTPTAWEAKDEATDGPAICAYRFQTIDGSCSALAHAICVHYEKEYPTDMETALIVLEEFAEHIDAYVRANRKVLERAKTYLEKEG